MAIPGDCLDWAAKLFDPSRIAEKPEALSGLLHLTGDPDTAPVKVGSWISAYGHAATLAADGVL